MNAEATLDMEIEYANPAMVQEYLQAINTWAKDAAAYREAAGARAHIDLPYGDSPRQRVDVFEAPKSPGGPVALFIHGGYWQVMDKSSFSHMARGPNERGVTVAVAGYTLCPETTIAGIVGEIRAAVAFVAKRFGRPITVYGHSAGGHLSACMLATDWRAIDPSRGADVIRAAMPISGVFELEPLITTSLNGALRLDAEEARRMSPLFWKVPAGKSVVAYVGGNESSEFLRQTRALVERLRGDGISASGVEVPSASHFTVIAPLADPESSMTQDLVALAEGRRRS
jgi:arylformamidase